MSDKRVWSGNPCPYREPKRSLRGTFRRLREYNEAVAKTQGRDLPTPLQGRQPGNVDAVHVPLENKKRQAKTLMISKQQQKKKQKKNNKKFVRADPVPTLSNSFPFNVVQAKPPQIGAEQSAATTSSQSLSVSFFSRCKRLRHLLYGYSQRDGVRKWCREARLAVADEPTCFQCGRFAEYICDANDKDVCSLECMEACKRSDAEESDDDNELDLSGVKCVLCGCRGHLPNNCKSSGVDNS